MIQSHLPVTGSLLVLDDTTSLAPGHLVKDYSGKLFQVEEVISYNLVKVSPMPAAWLFSPRFWTWVALGLVAGLIVLIGYDGSN